MPFSALRSSERGGRYARARLGTSHQQCGQPRAALSSPLPSCGRPWAARLLPDHRRRRLRSPSTPRASWEQMSETHGRAPLLRGAGCCAFSTPTPCSASRTGRAASCCRQKLREYAGHLKKDVVRHRRQNTYARQIWDEAAPGRSGSVRSSGPSGDMAAAMDAMARIAGIGAEAWNIRIKPVLLT